MSRLFKETQGNSESRATAVSTALELDQMLETVREQQHVAAASLANMRIDSAKCINILGSTALPLLAPGSALSRVASESYRTLRTRIFQAQSTRGMKSLVVSSAVPGEGKTYNAANLAACFAQIPRRRVLLIDADLRTQGLTKLLGQGSMPGLIELLAGEAKPADVVLRTDVPNLYVVPAGNGHFSPPELFASSDWKEFIGWCGETFDTTIVDSPPITLLSDFELISSACDGVIAVVRALFTEREILKQANQSIDRKKLVGAIYNASETHRSRGHYKAYYYNNGKAAGATK